MSLTAETKQDFQPPKHKTSVETTSLLDSLRDAELAMSLAMKHGLWAEPEAITNRHISISLSLNLIEDHVDTIRTIIGADPEPMNNEGGQSDVG